MKMRNYWSAAVIGVLIVVGVWWAIAEVNDRKDPLNRPDAFVYSAGGVLDWFELTSHRGKVEGWLHEQKVIEEPGKVPVLEKKTYSLTGEKTEQGYAFVVDLGGKTISYSARFSGGNLIVQKQGETVSQSYKGVEEESLTGYKNAINEELQTAIDQSEEKEKQRLRTFFTELNNVYGYVASSADGSTLLFFQIDEANREGDVTGSLRMMKNNPYEETRYDVNGITDGLMVLLITTVDGKETRLKGNFHDGADRFDLSFWTDEKMEFHAVTENEYQKEYKAFKQK